MKRDEFVIGISDDILKDIGVGLGVGLGFIILGLINPSFIIGTPLVSFSFVKEMAMFDQFLVVVILAPILEEAFFRWTLFRGVAAILVNHGIDRNTVIIATVLITSALFAVFHYGFYGTNLQVAYIGAFLVGIIICCVMLWTDSLIPGTIIHAVINSAVLCGIFVIV